MRKFLISTIERRAGANFNLKDVGGRNVIANMTINSSTARHEAWISESDFLKFSKDLALLGRTPGCAVHVLKIEDTEAKAPTTPKFMEFLAGFTLAQDGLPLPDEASDAARAGHALALSEAKAAETRQAPQVSAPPKTSAPSNGWEYNVELTALVRVPYLKLKSIAKTDGVILEGLDKGSRALAAAILAHRKNTAAA